MVEGPRYVPALESFMKDLAQLPRLGGKADHASQIKTSVIRCPPQRHTACNSYAWRSPQPCYIVHRYLRTVAGCQCIDGGSRGMATSFFFVVRGGGVVFSHAICVPKYCRVVPSFCLCPTDSHRPTGAELEAFDDVK